MFVRDASSYEYNIMFTLDDIFIQIDENTGTYSSDDESHTEMDYKSCQQNHIISNLPLSSDIKLSNTKSSTDDNKEEDDDMGTNIISMYSGDQKNTISQNTQSSSSSKFISQPNPALLVVYTLEQDQLLSEKIKLEQLWKLRCEIGQFYNATLYYKGLYEVAEAHSTFIKDELTLAKVQIENLKHKQSCCGICKIKVHIMVHTEQEKKYAKKLAEKNEEERLDIEEEERTEMVKTECEQQMKEEKQSWVFLSSLSMYKYNDDLVVLAQVLKINDTRNKQVVYKQIHNYIYNNLETLSSNPQLYGLFPNTQCQKLKEAIPMDNPPLSKPLSQTWVIQPILGSSGSRPSHFVHQPPQPHIYL